MIKNLKDHVVHHQYTLPRNSLIFDKVVNLVEKFDIYDITTFNNFAVLHSKLGFKLSVIYSSIYNYSLVMRERQIEFLPDYVLLISVDPFQNYSDVYLISKEYICSHLNECHVVRNNYIVVLPMSPRLQASEIIFKNQLQSFVMNIVNKPIT
jgi:hypothetical protein